MYNPGHTFNIYFNNGAPPMIYNIDKAIAKTILTLGLGFSILSLPAITSAAVIFSQGFDPTNFEANGPSDFGSSTQKADDFSILQDSTLGSVSWQGIYLNGTIADNFTLRIFTDTVVSTPTQTPFWSENVGNLITRTSETATFGELFTYEANLSAGVSLTAGTTYWLSIVNDTTNNWSWAASSTGGLAANRSLDSDTWAAGNGTFQFQLSAVPVPGAIWFLGSGLLGLAFSKRNQKTLD
jgi:hypothetical protein